MGPWLALLQPRCDCGCFFRRQASPIHTSCICFLELGLAGRGTHLSTQLSLILLSSLLSSPVFLLTPSHLPPLRLPPLQQSSPGPPLKGSPCAHHIRALKGSPFSPGSCQVALPGAAGNPPTASPITADPTIMCRSCTTRTR